MSKEKRCYGCMRIKEESGVCSYCGYDDASANAEHQLPAGTVLKEQYLIGKVLGQGGFGITYMGWDLYLDIPVAIKEYFPNGQVMRNSNESTSVISYSGDAGERFQKNKDRFMREARMLARFADAPQVVQVKTFFLANNTAYIVMEYLSGITVKNLVEDNGPLTADAALWLLAPVIRALKTVHKSGLIHRDISPDNIMIQEYGRVKLLDFGAGRDVGTQKMGQMPTKSTEAILKQGYAPLEQYQGKGRIGQWTDVYALCATLYYCMTGEVPPDAPERILGEAELGFEKEGISVPEELQQIISAGMELRIEDRINSMDQLYSLLEEKKLIPQEIPESLKKLIQTELKNETDYYTVSETKMEDTTDSDHQTVTDDQSEQVSAEENKKKTEDNSGDIVWKAGALAFLAVMVIVALVLGLRGQKAATAVADAEIEAEIAEGNTIVEGRCGAHSSFRLSLKTGKLQIFGNGDTWDFATEEEVMYDESLMAAPWSRYKSYIKEVDLGAISKIGDNAFIDCENLTEVNWGNVNVIGCGAFMNTGLTGVELPKETIHIAYQAFFGCKNLEEIALPENLRVLEAGALAATKVKAVRIGMYTEIWENEWENPFWKEGLTMNVLKIQGYAGSRAQEFALAHELEFEELEYLEGKTLQGRCGQNIYWMVNPDTRTLTLTGYGATWDYSSDMGHDPYNPNQEDGWPEWYDYRLAIEKVVILDGVTRIGHSLFRDCEHLTEVRWGKNIKELGVISFLNTGITSMELPEGLEVVEGAAFAACWQLEEITFPASLRRLDKEFSDCPNLKKFVIYGNPEVNLENPEEADYFWNWDENTPRADVVVYGYRGTSAQMLAQEEGVPFIALDE